MRNTKSIALGVGILLVLFFAGRFFYFNIIVPWPYREELKACLSEARALESEEAVNAAENRCFDMYPHFN